MSTNFSRGAPSRAALGFGLLDLLPVAESDHIEPALGRQRDRSPPAVLLRCAEHACGEILDDPLDHRQSRRGGWCRSSPSARASPSRRSRARADPALVVGEAALALVERHAGDRRAVVADAGDHQIGGDRRRSRPCRLRGRLRPACARPRSPSTLSVADQREWGRQTSRSRSRCGLSARVALGDRGEAAQVRDRLAHAGFEQRVLAEIGQVGGIDARAGALEVHQFAQFLGRHHDLVRPAPAEDDHRADVRMAAARRARGRRCRCRRIRLRSWRGSARRRARRCPCR